MDKKIKFSQCGKYIVLRTLGSGFSAKVKLAQDPDTQIYYALKILRSNLILSNNLKAFTNEINIMKVLDHPNLIHLIEYQENVIYQKNSGQKEKKVCMVLELAQGGELFEFVAQTGCFSMDTSRFYFKQMICALQYLHSNGVAHRDLKPENILLDANFNLKLADFGFATFWNKNSDGLLNTILGTEGYMAPEISLAIPYDGKLVDIFAAGVILFIIYTGYPPFKIALASDFYFNMLIEDKNSLFWDYHTQNLSDPEYFPRDLRTLLDGMLQPDPSKRFTIKQVSEAQWMYGKANTLQEIKEEFPQRKRIVDNEIEEHRMQRKQDKFNRGKIQQSQYKLNYKMKWVNVNMEQQEYNFDEIEAKYKLNETKRIIKQFYGKPLNAFFVLADKDFILRYLLQSYGKYCTEILKVDKEKYKLTAILYNKKDEESLIFSIQLKEVNDVQLNLDIQKLEGDTIQFNLNAEKIKKLIEYVCASNKQ